MKESEKFLNKILTYVDDSDKKWFMCHKADIKAYAKIYHKEQLTLTGVGCSKITALVTYWLWQDSGHAMMDDYKHTFKKVVEVEKLTDINELFTNVAKIEILK